MNVKEKLVLFGTFLSACLSVALLAGSLGSQHWIVSSARRQSNPKSTGHVNFGLFRGTRRLNHGFGERVYDMDVFQVQYREKDFLIRELYVTTIACVGAAILFGVISACLALFNTGANPEEPVCQFPGLITVNVIAFVLTLAAVVSWLVEFFLKFRKNVLQREDVTNGGWESEGLAGLGYSFWLVVLAAVLLFANAVVVAVLQRRKSAKRRHGSKAQVIDSGKPNGNLMLY